MVIINIRKNYYINLNKIHINEICNLAETGDIIYFRWTDVDIMHEIVSPFTHIGLVIINPYTKHKYIIETHLKGDGKELGVLDGGIQQYNLNDRLQTYEGHTYLSKLKNVYKPNLDQVLKLISNFKAFKKDIPFYGDYSNYFKMNCIKYKLCNDCFTIEEKAGLFCSEFVGFCLKELQIVNNDFNYKCMTPGDFMYISDANKNLLYDDKLLQVKK
jgi:hypothetical protein